MTNCNAERQVLMGGQGLTPWERMGAEQQAQYAQELEQQIAQLNTD